jgi:hypothetical protein
MPLSEDRINKKLQATVDKLARGRVPSDRALTLLCEGFVRRFFPVLVDHIAETFGPVAVDMTTIFADIVEVMKSRIRAGELVIEISANGDKFRFVPRPRTH